MSDSPENNPPTPPPEEQRPAASPPPGAPEPGTPGSPPLLPSQAESMEESGTQALAEALASSFKIIKILMIGLVVAFFASGIFSVQPNEVAVVLRFGRPVGVGPEQLLQPGLHWHFPYPIDEVVRIPVGETHSLTSTAGWYAITPQERAKGITPPALPFLRPGVDGYTLTARGNIIHVRATIKYRISDPIAYRFNFRNPTNLLQNILNNALFYTSAQYTADTAIYSDKTGFKETLLERVRQKISQIHLGIQLEPTEVETTAPLDVQPAFDAVLSAEQTRSQKINEAQGYQDELTRKAAGEAQAIISAGIADSNRLVSAVAAEAQYVAAQAPYYREDPELFKKRLLTASMQRILSRTKDTWYLPIIPGEKESELRLQLSRIPEVPGLSSSNAPASSP